jgi:hypothetical protein
VLIEFKGFRNTYTLVKEIFLKDIRMDQYCKMRLNVSGKYYFQTKKIRSFPIKIISYSTYKFQSAFTSFIYIHPLPSYQTALTQEA